MEIRNVVTEVKNEYPKMKGINKKHLANNIPTTWQKVGLSSFVIAMLMKNRAFASSASDATNTLASVDSAGAVTVVSTPIIICYYYVCPILQVISSILFIVTGLSILITKIKAKKKNEPKKVKKWLIVLFIISIILFILSILAKPILRAMVSLFN